MVTLKLKDKIKIKHLRIHLYLRDSLLKLLPNILDKVPIYKV